jgi:hypothetical protein
MEIKSTAIKWFKLTVAILLVAAISIIGLSINPGLSQKTSETSADRQVL